MRPGTSTWDSALKDMALLRCTACTSAHTLDMGGPGLKKTLLGACVSGACVSGGTCDHQPTQKTALPGTSWQARHVPRIEDSQARTAGPISRRAGHLPLHTKMYEVHLLACLPTSARSTSPHPSRPDQDPRPRPDPDPTPGKGPTASAGLLPAPPRRSPPLPAATFGTPPHAALRPADIIQHQYGIASSAPRQPLGCRTHSDTYIPQYCTAAGVAASRRSRKGGSSASIPHGRPGASPCTWRRPCTLPKRTHAPDRSDECGSRAHARSQCQDPA